MFSVFGERDGHNFNILAFTSSELEGYALASPSGILVVLPREYAMVSSDHYYGNEWYYL